MLRLPIEPTWPNATEWEEERGWEYWLSSRMEDSRTGEYDAICCAGFLFVTPDIDHVDGTYQDPIDLASRHFLMVRLNHRIDIMDCGVSCQPALSSFHALNP